MIKRDKWLNLLIQSKDNGFPKVITGIRRCGKSYLLSQIYYQYLVEHGVKEDHILLLSLDDDVNSSLRDPLLLGEYVRERCHDSERYYVFLDEIQRVYRIVNPNLTEGKHVLAKKTDEETISFVDVVLGLSHEKNIDLYVTGSNSKMLSTDIVTEFRDKATNIHIGPLSFEEFYGTQGGSATEALYQYMQYGGMPLAVLSDEDRKKQYLKNLFETTYFKDILEHNRLQKSESLDELADIISLSTGQLLNTVKIANTYKSVRHENIDKATVEKQLGYFKDAFLIREAKRFDVKGREEIGALRKYYFIDPGLRNARLNFAFPDEGQILENIIYNELVYHDYSVNVGTFDTIEKDRNGKSIRKTNEIDFIAKKGIRQFYIQVTDNLSNLQTRKREERPFLVLNDQIQKVIVVNRPITETVDENGFTIIGATDFLLRFI